MGDLVSTSFMVLLLYTWCCESAGTSDLPNEAINEQLLTTRTKFGNLDKHFSGLGAEALYFWALNDYRWLPSFSMYLQVKCRSVI